jgi:hypothetical protein
VDRRCLSAITRWALLVVAAIFAASCTTQRVTEPPQTATEQLVVSAAVDHAVDNLRPAIAPGAKIFVDDRFVDMRDDAAIVPKYAIGAVRELILRAGGRLVDDRKRADLVAELRTGAQSIDRRTFLVGIPAIPIPVPTTGILTTPELPLYRRDLQRGISTLALTIYGAKSGMLAAATGPVYGSSHYVRGAFLLLFSWDQDDVMPADIANPPTEP